MSCFDRQAIFSLAKAKVPDLSGAKEGGSSTQDKGKSAPRKPTVIDGSSLKGAGESGGAVRGQWGGEGWLPQRRQVVISLLRFGGRWMASATKTGCPIFIAPRLAAGRLAQRSHVVLSLLHLGWLIIG